SRSWTWIEPRLMFKAAPPCLPHRPGGLKVVGADLFCSTCPAGGGMPEWRHGLIWIGGSFYPTPGDFMLEANRMGVSRKLPAIPKDFKLGETWEYLAHREAVTRYEDAPRADIQGTAVPETVKVLSPGVFTMFKPRRIDLVIADEHNIPERALKLAEQLGEENCRIVKVVKAGEQQELAGTAAVGAN
ncbi:MAG: hypothetical protein ACRD3I_01810, partial [Terriglobales bacterium]